jgi:hypothetical protein
MPRQPAIKPVVTLSFKEIQIGYIGKAKLQYVYNSLVSLQKLSCTCIICCTFHIMISEPLRRLLQKPVQANYTVQKVFWFLLQTC